VPHRVKERALAQVTFDSVGKVYPDGTRALSDFGLDVADGEFVVFVGPSGCGKTTALRMVAGLEDITEGEIRIGERVVNELEPRERDVAMVFQNYALYPHMSVYDNIAFGLRMRKVQRSEIDRRVAEIGRVLGLSDMLKRKPKQLSGGQRQRVAMGRAIVRDPAVFLMDEPLSNLDARLRVQMRAEIARIQHELTATTIYVTHDQVEAMTMGDRVCVLRKGELQQTGPPQELYDRPANLFVASFIGSPEINLLRATVGLRDGELDALLGTQIVPLPGAPAPLRDYAGREVALGIRPEHVGSGPGNLTGKVLLSEALGSERLVHLELEAEPVATEEVLEVAVDTDATAAAALEQEAGSKRSVFRARVDMSYPAGIGEQAALPVDTSKAHFFDLDTGLAIR
jgi:multiple sugar transport system ATP-binding protein